MDLSNYQTIRESQSIYNELYKAVAKRSPKYLHYAMLRIAGITRSDSYVSAGYKDQGISYSGNNLNSTNAVHIEKNVPIVKDLIEIGMHLNMLKMMEKQKDRILTQEERMVLMSDIATGKHKVTELKKVTSIRKNKKVTGVKEFISTPNLNNIMKAVDILNKMDNTYKQEIVIRKSDSESLKDLTDEELVLQLKQFDDIINTDK